jgi:hypothetical protein
MKRNRKCAAALVLVIAAAMTAAAFNPSAAAKNDPPAVSAFAKSEQVGAVITFSEEDFASRVSGGEELEAIVISALPEGGVLRLAGRTLLRGEAISLDSMSTLAFVPDDETGDLFTSFSFLPVFSKSGAGTEAVTVSINVSKSKNTAPIAQDLEFKTFVDVKLCAALKCTDIDGDECTFTVVRQPKKGTVEIKENGFCYTPQSGKKGDDSFTYIATDARGNASKEATVSIDIRKRAAKETFAYTDMEYSPAHYAALLLRDEGILIGETFGGENFLYPEKAVSRAEFVALAAAVTELAMPTVAVGTGLSDNDAIPVWAQPYVAAAIHEGVIEGERSEDGNRVFRAADGITRAEAASIINKSLSLSNDGRGMQFADSANVPDWAAQCLVNTTAAEIVPVFADGTVRAGALVTREDAAIMLCEMMRYKEETADTGFFGLFR